MDVRQLIDEAKGDPDKLQDVFAKMAMNFFGALAESSSKKRRVIAPMSGKSKTELSMSPNEVRLQTEGKSVGVKSSGTSISGDMVHTDLPNKNHQTPFFGRNLTEVAMLPSTAVTPLPNLLPSPAIPAEIINLAKSLGLSI